MKGMDEVGRLFNDNELIVAEVLQSRRGDEGGRRRISSRSWRRPTPATRGTIVLATVKGDVHDIGKNLVEIILSNNGYQRRSTSASRSRPRTLIAAYHEHKPGRDRALRPAREVGPADGGHGAGPARGAASTIPLFVGGAALTKKFTAHANRGRRTAGSTVYAKDAMDGLDLANQLFSAPTRDALIDTPQARAGVDGGERSGRE